MRKIYSLLLSLLIFAATGFAQTYNMANGTQNNVGSGVFYDNGGVGGSCSNSNRSGNYSDGLNRTETFIPVAGNSLQFTFSSFCTENTFDFLYIYDGNSTGAPLIGSYTGNTSPGSLTFKFTSNGNTNRAGWAASISTIAKAVPYKDSWISMSTGSSTWCPGETRTVSVTVKNVGTATWTDASPDINIGVKWNADPDYLVRVNAGGLAPGATHTYNLTVTAPATIGNNNLTFDVVEEGVSWFGNNNGGTGPGNVVFTSPTITIATPTVNAGTQNPAICQGGTTAGLGGSVGGSATGGTWDDGGVGGTFNPSATTLNATWTPPAGYSGTATLTLTAISSCGSPASSKSQVVNPKPTATAGGTQTICQNGTATVSGASSSNGTIAWTENGAGSITAGATTLTPTYTAAAGDAGKTVTLTMTVSNSTCTAATATYSVFVKGTPTATAGGSKTVCVNSPATVSGANASNGTILWTHNGLGTLTNATTLTPTYTPAAGDAGNAVILTMKVSNSPCADATATYTVNVKAIPTASAGGSQTICQNGTATVSGASSSNGTIAWTENGAGSITAGATTLTPTYTAAAGDAGNTVTLTMTVSNSPCTAATATYSVFVKGTPTATAGGSKTICVNSPATVSGANASNGTILWTHNGLGTLTNATTLTPTYTPAAGDAGNAVILTMKVSNSPCADATATYTVNVKAIPTATAGGSQTICQNGTATVSGASSSNGTIAWTENGAGSITAGATSLTPTYTAAAGDAGNTVTLTMTVSNSPCTAATATYSVIVNPLPIATAGGTQNICATGSATVSGANAVNGTILWTDNGTGTLSDATTATPTYNAAPGDAGNTVLLTMTVTSNNACSPATATATYTVKVYSTPVVSTANAKTICDGTSTNIALTSVVPSSYSWTIGTITGNIAGATAGSGSTINQTLNNPSNTDAGTVEYIVTPTSTTGGCAGDPYTITVTVNPSPVVTPVNPAEICNNTAPGISLTASTPSSFSWTLGTNTGGITGASNGSSNTINQTLTNPSNTTAGSIQYIVTPTATAGGCPGAPYTITVTVDPTPVVTTPSTAVICTGGNTNISLTSSSPSSFSWTVGTITGGITGANPGSGNTISDVLINPDPSVAGTVQYLVTPTSTTGSCAGIPYTITVTVNAPAAITTQPTDQTSCSTFPVTFSVAATGTGLTYQWYKNGIAVSNSSNITGAQTANLHFAQVTTPFDAADYYVIVSGTAACANPQQSNTVHLTVNQQIVINNQPVSQAICTGGTATFEIDVTATGPTFQWNLVNTPLTDGTLPDGAVISGSQTNKLTISNATTAESFNNINVTTSTLGGGCQTSNSAIVSLVVNPVPVVSSVANKVFCNTTPSGAIAFTGGVSGVVYNWVNDNTAIGLGASGTGTISFNTTNATNGLLIAHITVTPSYTNAGSPSETCYGTPINFTITVNPTATVNAVADQTVCNGSQTTAINFSSPSTGGSIVYNWVNNTPSIGLAATGNGNISSFTGINNGTVPVKATITVTPSYTNGATCGGTPLTFYITVNPTATVNSISNQTLCNGAPTAAIAFSSPASGGSIVYNWTNNTPSIGLAASGSGNIASFNATNPGNGPVTATIVVTPSYTNGSSTCTGTTQTFTITVNPTATVNLVSDQTVCNNSSLPAINFSSITTGGSIVYNWTNNNTSVGLGASGSGNIGSFVAKNTGTTQVTAIITVTPSYTNGGVTCTGTPISFNIFVNPTVTISPLTQEVCNASAITPISITGLPTGTITSWTRTTPSGISSSDIGAGGSGSISGTFTNSTTASINVVFTINAQAGNGCTSTFTATVLVDAPLVPPTVSATQVVCFGNNPAPLTSTPPKGGSGVYAYQWQSSSDGSTNWTDVPGAINNSYSPPNNSNYYRLKVTSCETVYSNEVQIAVALDLGTSFNLNPKVATICAEDHFDASVSSISIIGFFYGIKYSWQSQDPGFITSPTTNPYGSGFLIYTGTATFYGHNSTNTSVTKNLLITPIVYYNGNPYCNLTTQIIPVTINPVPVIADASTSVCSGALFTVSPANGTPSTNVVPSGTTYSWGAPTVTGGLTGGAGGTGTSITGTLTNPTNSAQTAIYTVTPTAPTGSCAGNTFKVTVTVNPKAVVPNQAVAICSGATFTVSPANAPPTTIIPSGTNYTWNAPAAIAGISGLAGGTALGNISGTLTNSTNLPINVTYAVTATAGTCAGVTFNVTVTVNPTLIAGTVTGTSPLCIGQTATFTTTGSAGGSWSSSNTGVATINSSTGLVTAVSQGNTNIVYAINSGCGTPVSSTPIALTVNSNAVAGTVTGTPNAICIGATTTYSSNGTSGGSWTSSNTAVATVVAGTGVITGIAQGTATISYTVGGCNPSAPATKDVTVNPDANAGALTASGSTTLCITQTVTFTSDGDGGGTWSTDKPSVATVSTSGVVTAVGAGNANITYTVSTGCNNPKSVSAPVTVNPNANAGTLTGPSTLVCVGTQIQFKSTGDAGGVWSSDDGSVATVDQNGVITATGPGTTTITYTVGSGCNPPSVATKVINTTNAGATATPGPITGPSGPICANSSPYTFTVDPIENATYYVWTLPAGWSIISGGTTNSIIVKTSTTSGPITVSAGNACDNNPLTGPALTIYLHNVWSGATSIDWNTGSNWADGNVADIGCGDVYIPNVNPNHQPSLSSGTATINNLHIFSGATLTVTNATMQIAGTISNAGKFDATNGTVELNGAATQNIEGNNFANTSENNTVKNLIISNNVNVANLANDTLNVTGLVSFGTGTATLNTGNNLTLKSTKDNTASIGTLKSSNSVSGKVEVERYINIANGADSHGKKWQLLATPTQGQTLLQSWMENKSSTPGYGAQFTGTAGTSGFDAASIGPSVKYWDETSGTWVEIGNTPNTPLYNTHGYLTFIRGDRSVDGRNVTTATPTTLRSKGTITTGPVSFIVPKSSSVNNFFSIGNPYPSTVDMTQVTTSINGTNELLPFIYVWNPNLGGEYGVGAWDTYELNGSQYFKIPGQTLVAGTIQSGQAFLVQTDANYPRTVPFNEINKLTTSTYTNFRSGQLTGNAVQLVTSLLTVNNDGSTSSTDGTLQQFDRSYTNKVNSYDARKIMNSANNFSIKSGGVNLIVERRTPLTEQDTIQYNMANMAVQNYRLEFKAQGLSAEGVEGFVEDTYLNTRTPLNLEGTTDVNFAITSDKGSSATGRFRIVFKTATVLPVKIVSVTAEQKDANIEVDWKVENEHTVKLYAVEKSIDGVNFKEAYNVAAGNNGDGNYQWLDVQATPGYNYYRIRMEDQSGQISYSSVVKALIPFGKPSIGIYPNPITDGIVHLQLTNQPKGKYGIRLLNPLGQTIAAKQIEHAGGNATENLKWDYSLAHGVYELQVLKPDGKLQVIKVMY